MFYQTGVISLMLLLPLISYKKCGFTKPKGIVQNWVTTKQRDKNVKTYNNCIENLRMLEHNLNFIENTSANLTITLGLIVCYKLTVAEIAMAL